MKRTILTAIAALALIATGLVLRDVRGQRRAARFDAEIQSEGDPARGLGRWNATFTSRQPFLMVFSRTTGTYRGTIEIRALRRPLPSDSLRGAGPQLAAVLIADLDQLRGTYPDTLQGLGSIAPTGALLLRFGSTGCGDCGNLLFELRPSGESLRGPWMQETIAHAWEGPAVLRR